MEIIFTILKLMPAVLIPALVCMLVVFVNEKVNKEEEAEDGDLVRTKSSKSYKVMSLVFLVISAIIYATVIVILYLHSGEFSTFWHILFGFVSLVIVAVPTLQLLTAITTYEVIYEDGIRLRRLVKSSFVKYDELYCYRAFIDQFVVYNKECQKVFVIDKSRENVDLLLERFAEHGIYVYVDEEEKKEEPAEAVSDESASDTEQI